MEEVLRPTDRPTAGEEAGSELSRQAWRHIGSQRGEAAKEEEEEEEEEVQQIRWESLVRPGARGSSRRKILSAHSTSLKVV